MQFVIKTFDQLDSTQRWLESRLGNEDLPEGLVVCAIDQSKGQGQEGNLWFSESGQNLTFSLLFKPDFLGAARQFSLNIAIALGIADYLGGKDEIPAPMSLKWPNDFYLGRKKAGGMILNNAVCGDRIQWCIAGIGLNINQIAFPENCPNPVSLKLESEITYDLPKELELVLGCIDHRYKDLARGKSKQQKAEYLNLIFQFGIEATYVYAGQYVKARIEDVDEFGRLLLRQDGGHQLCCDIKEIQYVI